MTKSEFGVLEIDVHVQAVYKVVVVEEEPSESTGIGIFNGFQTLHPLQKPVVLESLKPCLEHHVLKQQPTKRKNRDLMEKTPA